MVSVILIWAYMTVTAYLAGFGFLSLLPGINKYAVKYEDSYLWAGMAVITVYAQAFSLFGGVGLYANLFLCAGCMAVAVVRRKQLGKRLMAFWNRRSPGPLIIGVLLLILLAFGASRGIIHYDTDLYHAQSIRWIEEFGIVPGLGNLHLRLAYDSASFAFSALYGMKFLGGQSFHAGPGFLVVLVTGLCLGGIGRGRRKTIGLADLARIIAGYYLLNIYDEMVSPASDYFMVLLFIFIIIRWLDLLEQNEQSYLPYLLLSLLAAFLLTVKFSAALILLLALKPLVLLFKQKGWGAIAGFVGLGILTMLPSLVRKVILSGWLLYPSTFFDWFNPDWKIPKGVADYDFHEIQVWGRGYTDVTAYDRPLIEWVGEWFAAQSRVDKVFILAAAGTGVILFWQLVRMIIRKNWKGADQLLVAGTVSACFYFWLVSTPLIRYGSIYVWLAPVLTYGSLYLNITFSNRIINKYLLLYFVMTVVGGYKMITFGKELWQMVEQAAGSSRIEQAWLIRQKDYGSYSNVPYELHGYTFYYAGDGDRTGYDDFPAAPGKAADIFRGETLEEGFRPADN